VRAYPLICLASLAIALSGFGAAAAQAPTDPAYPAASANPAKAPGVVNADCGVDQCSDRYFAPWTFSADALFMQRSSPGEQPLARTGPLGTGALVFDASDFDFDMSGGWRIGALRHGLDCDLEFNYFQIDGFNATTELPYAPWMVTDAEGGHLHLEAPWLEYRSRLYSTEVNLRRARNEWLTLLAGFRYLELDEHYRTAGLYSFGPLEFPAGFSEETANQLWGFQVGGDGTLLCRGRLSIQGLAKAGIYLNHSKQFAEQLNTAPNIFDYHAFADKDGGAFVGELGLLAKYQLSEHLVFRVGYQLTWLDGVALATDQIGASDFGITGGVPSTGIEADNTVLYHGAVVGAEMTW
jgi:hypothetical protein